MFLGISLIIHNIYPRPDTSQLESKPTTGVLEARIFDRRMPLLVTEALADENFELHPEVVCTNNSGEFMCLTPCNWGRG